MTRYLLERAWVGGAFHDDVVVDVADGRFTHVVTNAPATSPPTSRRGSSGAG